MFHEAHVTVTVEDLDRAARFYTDALSLSLKARYGDGFAEVQAPGLTTGLHPASAHGPQSGQSGRTSLGFSVTPIETAMAQLRAK